VTAIGITLGGFVTLATGISLVYLLMGIPGRGSKSRVLTTVCLGLAVGVVLTSCGHFFWQEVLSRTPSTFLLVDVGLLLVVASALRLRSTRRSVVDPSAGTVGPTQRIVAVPLLSAASLAAVFAGAAFVLHQLTGREGAWDAVSIWNLKAHFLLRAGPYWSDAIDPALLQSHPDYPLLLPLTIARIWRYAGGIDSTFVPIAAAAIFTTVVGTAALCGVAYAAATFIRSIDAAAPLVMLIMFTLNAVSGIYIPENLFPAWLRDIAQVLPIRPLAEAMQAAFAPQANGGRYFAWGDMLIVAAWGVAGALYAVRRFRWTPSQD